MNYSLPEKESVLPLGMKLTQMVSRNPLNNCHNSYADKLNLENIQNSQSSNEIYP